MLALGPRLLIETDPRRPRRPMDGPDFERPTQNPLPRDLRRWKRKGIYFAFSRPVWQWYPYRW
jgi:hypothetical protein